MYRAPRIVQYLLIVGLSMCCIAAVGLSFYQDFVDERAINHRMEAEGVKVTARVVGVENAFNYRGQLVVLVTYTYQVDGANYSHTVAADTRQIQGVTYGSRLSIHYAASDPSVSEIIGNKNTRNLRPYLPYAQGLTLCFGSVLMVGIVANLILARGLRPKVLQQRQSTVPSPSNV